MFYLATSSSTITDTGIGTGSSLLEMQITREELGATFTCKVNSIALVEPLTVDIKPDIHGEYTYSRITVEFATCKKKPHLRITREIIEISLIL